jgi:ATP-dependent Clp protease ATP-binding subunit ClpA
MNLQFSPPATPRLKKVLALAKREAEHMGHDYVGVDHLLLGIIREGESTAFHILGKQGVTMEFVKAHITKPDEEEKSELFLEREAALSKLTDRDKELLGIRI